MCGYAGFALGIGRDEKIDRDLLAAMGQSIHLRGPDDQGIWCNDALQIGLVHQRLAIQDLSPLGAQPMNSPSGRYTIAFNGEIYNFKRLRNRLKDIGFEFKSGSDTEVMLAAFEAWGVESSLTEFSGMFSIALVDNQTNELWLIRDRLGEKPLYYYVDKGVLIFGSELKALMTCSFFKKDIEISAVGLLMRHNYIPAPWTIFKKTYKLEPAHFIRFDLRDLNQQPVSKKYWQPSLEWDIKLTQDSLHEKLEPLLEEVIADQMISDAPLGAFLSGGIDSSTIVSLMQKQARQPIKTFSVGFNVDGFNEAEHAKAVANHLGTEHTEYYVEPEDALDLIPKLPEIYDEPYADSSQIPTYIVSRMTRQKVTVALSGDGGDELFAGYSRYAEYSRGFERQRKGFGKLLMNSLGANVAATVTKIIKKNQRTLSNDLIIEKISRYNAAYNAKNSREFYQSQISYWLNPEHEICGAKRLPYGLDTLEIRDDATACFQWCDLNSYLPDDILVKVDRAAMANSLETRVPLLDHRIVELALTVPTHLNIKNNVTKQPLRKILYQHVPTKLVDRPKQGFGVPKAYWLRNELREWAEDLLSEQSLTEHGIFKTNIIRQKWLAHLYAGHDYSFHLWSVLMFQSWYRVYMR